MTERRAIVNPVRGKNPPETGSVAVMVATETDVKLLTRLSSHPPCSRRKLYMSSLYMFEDEGIRHTVVGPLVGAPYAAMVLEALVTWGVDKVIFVGWCGAVSPEVKAGDIIIPDSAMVNEGTSGHYCDPSCHVAIPSKVLTEKTCRIFDKNRVSYHRGTIWTTDAIFRETREKVRYYQKKGALAVEMELSAVFTVAGFRGIQASGILVVSDEVSSLEWKPGFKTDVFKKARESACHAAHTLCQGLK